MIDEFIAEFRTTSYFNAIINKPGVIAAYIVGSRCFGLEDKLSDYDFLIYTVDGRYTHALNYTYLTYKNKKVHWYYVPISSEFDYKLSSSRAYTGIFWLVKLTKDITIYENPKYSKLIQKLYEMNDTLNIIRAYYTFKSKKDYIEDILRTDEIHEKHYSKNLYYLCLTSYFLTKEEFDKDFLIAIKRIRFYPVSIEYKKLAIERLKIYKIYIESKDLMSNIDLDKMFNEMMDNLS